MFREKNVSQTFLRQIIKEKLRANACINVRCSLLVEATKTKRVNRMKQLLKRLSVQRHHHVNSTYQKIFTIEEVVNEQHSCIYARSHPHLTILRFSHQQWFC